MTALARTAPRGERDGQGYGHGGKDRGGGRAEVLLVAHGTRSAEGTRTARELARGLAARLRRPVEVAYADVRGPTVTEALARRAGPVTLVPAFLASGYHVRADIPAQVRRAGAAEVLATPALGADPALLPALADRLAAADVREGDSVVLAAAGSSDPEARAEAHTMAGLLGRLLHRPVPVAWAATAEPSVAATVARLRASGARRVAVATWLLAPGVFAERLAASGADTVAAPLAAHPSVLETLARRVTETERVARAGRAA
ncbi:MULTISPECIES: CbiX/SirB N-terminal domain-containing protein [unclassified Streptomyces]|uniref:sirohydrochlorin chelatase n=1 Tax=unclassified Streptomyces TaxID=2593676 RepID=UPI002DDA29B3|nr:MULTISPECIES: CbiX/SirB N-terminal domain-containing protein [unclassified Streptomyces]WSA95268.1 sirohydrochlorin chelatase [Streptomyces sp. NBC_01795]WSB79686.1 sirohydrochlorin chelatase [Streptomyces sp. NBC_01775]WSS12111.1 sirohydrochlorin chelatase [Streptomyces sp. NBC_01186]WSS40822.1 sirohydrochlorin chelatase [Streptomyces sp. NBC_01187]